MSNELDNKRSTLVAEQTAEQTAERSKQRIIHPFVDRKRVLKLAQEVEELVEEKKWSWCDLRMVYRLLEILHI